MVVGVDKVIVVMILEVFLMCDVDCIIGFLEKEDIELFKFVINCVCSYMFYE